MVFHLGVLSELVESFENMVSPEGYKFASMQPSDKVLLKRTQRACVGVMGCYIFCSPSYILSVNIILPVEELYQIASITSSGGHSVRNLIYLYLMMKVRCVKIPVYSQVSSLLHNFYIVSFPSCDTVTVYAPNLTFTFNTALHNFISSKSQFICTICDKSLNHNLITLFCYIMRHLITKLDEGVKLTHYKLCCAVETTISDV